MDSPTNATPYITPTTLTSLTAILLITSLTYLLSRLLLPPQTSLRLRVLFLWQAFDCLIHFLIEAPFLYTCFFTSVPLSTLHNPPASSTPLLSSLSLTGNAKSKPTYFPATPPNVYFLGRKEHAHGALYGDSWAARLWQEYAKADRRWGGADLGVVSLEVLTVGVMAPLGVWVCVLLWRAGRAAAVAEVARVKGLEKVAWFWAAVVATGELYGGFMTFAPEWLAGSPNLDTSNWMYLWLYLFFFNTLWVWLPFWVLWQAYWEFTSVEASGTRGSGSKESRKSK